ncbi:unnamed protein product [Mytilus coruscus]|uniref:Uncharacterized protein n=1 Tax=Mytilus coruscus TaxID=42192 RepID=A0A6J8AEY0_MYTCO|nr:unnamed protein product [Mytilus coruscus]
MAEAFITAIHSASEEANSPKATPSRSDKNEKSSVKQTGSCKKSTSKSSRKSSTASSTCAKEVSDEAETFSTTGLSLNVENELRAEISSVKETVNSVNSRGHQETDREIATSGGQNISQDSRDIATSGGQNSLRHASVANHDNDIDDAISLQLDRDERREIFGIVDKDSHNAENVSRDILGDIFGEDAKTKPGKSEGGIVLDQSQINILNQSWHCDKPLLLSTYKEEYRASFPVSDKSADILNFPKLDDISQTLLCKRHGPKAGKTHNKLFSQPEKTFENMAFKGQSAARMGLVITAYMLWVH